MATILIRSYCPTPNDIKGELAIPKESKLLLVRGILDNTSHGIDGEYCVALPRHRVLPSHTSSAKHNQSKRRDSRDSILSPSYRMDQKPELVHAQEVSDSN